MDTEPTNPKTPQEMVAEWMASDPDRLLGSEADSTPRPLLGGEEPAATATGDYGVSVRVFMGSPESPGGSESCAAGSASEEYPHRSDGFYRELDPQPLMITRRDPANGDLQILIFQPPTDGEFAQEKANRMRDATVEAMGKIKGSARARDAELLLHPDLPVCFWCEHPIQPGTEYTPDGGDRDDNPLPDEPFHQECALDYDPRFSALSDLTKRRLAEWEARHAKWESDE